tara:strand:+ start:1019 stop:1366 length:348 start_codon:yes stop_codon:yes gene_type:complete
MHETRIVNNVCKRDLSNRESIAVYALLLLEKLVILKGASTLSNLRTTSDVQLQKAKWQRRRSAQKNYYHPSRCNTCANCLRKPCGNCVECRDKPALGGLGIRKKPCVHRICMERI